MHVLLAPDKLVLKLRITNKEAFHLSDFKRFPTDASCMPSVFLKGTFASTLLIELLMIQFLQEESWTSQKRVGVRRRERKNGERDLCLLVIHPLRRQTERKRDQGGGRESVMM